MKPSENSNPETGSAEALIPPRANLQELRRIAAGCRACDLWKRGTQTVFGEGSAHAKVMFVGEQPGDREDIEGKPFVGPAGRILDEGLAAAAINRDEVYVTNVVKHFRWVAATRGKKRIHKKPRASEINACRPWLDAELARVQPTVLVCLGATAAQALNRDLFEDSLKNHQLRAFRHRQVWTRRVVPRLRKKSR